MNCVSTFRFTKPVLVIGKGPSSARVKEMDLSQYDVITLNQACILHQDIAHFIDYEPFIESHEWVKKCRAVWMPTEPHFRQVRGHGEIEKFMSHDPVLRSCDLYLYNLGNGRDGFLTGIRDGFSIVTVLDLLGQMGIKTINLLGIDGGILRAEPFQENYREHHVPYDPQFQWIHEMKRKHQLEIKHL